MLSYANIEVKKIHREREMASLFSLVHQQTLFITEVSVFSQYSAIGYIRLIYRQISHQTNYVIIGGVFTQILNAGIQVVY